MIDFETIFDSDREEYEFMQEKKEKQMKEQIEELWNIITTDCDNKCVGCEFENDDWCFTHRVVREIYKAGYRKVIHCKDCAYRDTEGCPNTYWNGGELESNVEDDSFCSGAKMKGGAE